MKFDFRKLIIPVILFIFLVGIVYGVVSFVKRDNTTSQNQESVEPLFTELSPAQNLETEEKAVSVFGQTKSRRNQIFINEEKVKVDKDGKFSKEVSLKNGVNEIVVRAETPNKMLDERKLTITKKAPGAEQAPVSPQKPEEESADQPDQNITEETVPSQNLPKTSENGPLAETGPKENAALAITAIAISYYYWRRSKLRIKKA